MINLCSNKHKQIVLDYIGTEYYKCLYLYIDLIKYGCESNYTKVWIVSERDQIQMVMLAYHSALHLYSQENDFCVSEIVEFIREKNPSIICASVLLIEKLRPVMSKYGYDFEYGHVGMKTHKIQIKKNYQIKKAGDSDIEQIAKLLYDDDDIGASYSFEDLVGQIRERLSQGFVRSFVIKQEGRVVAHLGTGAEIENLCTISYVITDSKYRGLGLSTSLFNFACQQLESEGKEIYSVYYPENSRRLHHKMGFEDKCEFGKLFKTIR